MSEQCGWFASVFVADLREVDTPCGLIWPARSEERPGGSEQLLGGTVGFLRQRSHHRLLGRPPVRTLLTANDQSYYVMLLFPAVPHTLKLSGAHSLQLLMWTVIPFFCRGEDKCLQGLANATISGMTTHTTCMYLGMLPVVMFTPWRSLFLIFSVFLFVMLSGWCMQAKASQKGVGEFNQKTVVEDFSRPISIFSMK